jgi:ABC-type glycerol-3-phosphate transport system substrate-binding protein
MRSTHNLGFKRRVGVFAAAGLMLTTGLAAITAGSAGASNAKVTLTFWENYGTQQTLLGTAKNLISAYEKLHPNVTIKMVSQPADNYFAQLQTAAIAGTGPDLAVMWTGLYLPPYANLLANLRPYFPKSEIANIEGLKWGANDFNASSAILAAPVDAQFYMGFYNKKDFVKAGIKTPPRDWSQLLEACTALKKVGITPMAYGTGSASYSGEFNPWYSFSYMMMALPPSQWHSLYSGQIPWTSSVVKTQLSMWHEMYTKGCVNSDALTDRNNVGQFVDGKAAMAPDDGSWDVAQYTQQMGTNVGAMVPPFSTKPESGVVFFPGDAISVLKNSKNVPAAAAFLAFMDSPAGAVQIAKAGLIPDITGYHSTNALNDEMLAFVTKDHYTVYPMLDNVTQPNIVNVGYQALPAVLVGQASVKQGTGELAAQHNQLPANQRGAYGAYFK